MANITNFYNIDKIINFTLMAYYQMAVIANDARIIYNIYKYNIVYCRGRLIIGYINITDTNTSFRYQHGIPKIFSIVVFKCLNYPCQINDKKQNIYVDNKTIACWV